MKNLSLFIVVFIFNINVFSQEKDISEENNDLERANHLQENNYDVPFQIIQEVPVFPDCENQKDKKKCYEIEIKKHIDANFNYPLVAKEKGTQGKVYLSYSIEKNGKFIINAVRAPSPDLDFATRKIFDNFPILKPAKQRGKEVRMTHSLVITYKL